jgi:hypothetical protein
MIFLLVDGGALVVLGAIILVVTQRILGLSGFRVKLRPSKKKQPING